MKRTQFLLLLPVLFLVQSFQSFGQMTTVWQKQMTGTGFFLNSKVAPDGKVYSVGYFWGKKAVFGNTEIWADTVFDPNVWTTGNADNIESTGFVACQDMNGDFVWARPVTTYCGIDGMTLSHICVDGAGNAVVAGNFYYRHYSPVNGWSASFNSVPFFQIPNDPQGDLLGGSHFAFVLKISPQGDLLWNKVFRSGRNSQNLHLEFVNNTIELLVQHNDTLKVDGAVYCNGLTNGYINEYALLKLTTDGTVISVQNRNFHNLVVPPGPPSGRQGLQRIFIRRLPNLSWALALFDFATYGTMVVDISPDFSTILDTVSFKTRSATAIANNYFNPGPVLVLGDIVQLPDGKRGYIFQFDTRNYGDEKLIWKNDTLDLGIPPTDTSLGTNTNIGNAFLLKTEGTSCIKQVLMLPPVGTYYGLGANQTSTGNFFTIPNYFPSALKQFDRNGNFISSLDLSQAHNSVIESTEFEFGDALIEYGDSKIEKAGNHLYISYGPYLTKVLINEVATTDVSFSGCLSNRTLLTTIQEQELRDVYVFKMDQSIVYHQSSNEDGLYRLVNALGQTISEGDLSGLETRIQSKGQPKGIYMLTIQQKNKQTTHRVMW
ncbi:MAG TPA: T9SS type A sorting domain-containing protein [Catalimonadaceae bacterium]|nr:T9SS type A sorting domain-containing protein [Catalimonadaceae bacterium]